MDMGRQESLNQPSRVEAATLAVAALALVAILELRLLAAFIAGLLVYELADALARRLSFAGLGRRAGKAVALAVVLVLTLVLIALAGFGLYGLLTSKSDSLVALLQKMADAIDAASLHLPAWVQDSLPTNTAELDAAASDWLRSHAGALQVAGEGFVRGLTHILAGIVVGSLAAIGIDAAKGGERPLVAALGNRLRHLRRAFRGVVFAQIRISALNTALTAIYLAGILPAIGIHLPLTKTMIVVTFVVGLLPILGNLISNSVIVVISLSVSLYTALGSLVFLIAIHKLEYFVNAHIIGGQIRARAWELLLAMLVMDAAFGVPGVIVAPIYYAYLKGELAARGLI